MIPLSHVLFFGLDLIYLFELNFARPLTVKTYFLCPINKTYKFNGITSVANCSSHKRPALEAISVYLHYKWTGLVVGAASEGSRQVLEKKKKTALKAQEVSCSCDVVVS